jgi:Leucine-rich repeat (LRR) protein
VSLGLAYLIPVLGLLFQVAFGNSGMLTDAACILLVTSLVVGGYFIVLTHWLLWVRRKMVAAQLPLQLQVKDLRRKGSDESVLGMLAPVQTRVSRLLWQIRWLLVAGAGVCVVLFGIRVWKTNQRIAYLRYMDKTHFGVLEIGYFPIDNFVEHFLGMRPVRGAQLGTRSISRDKLASCPPLSRLTLIPELENISLQGQLVNKDDLAVIRSLRKLRSINLMGTPIDDDSLDLISGLKKLEVLDLSATIVSDAAVHSLSKLENLTELRIEHSDITPAGIEQLKSLLPRTRIVGSQTPSSAHRQTIVDLLSRGATCYHDDQNELHIIVYGGDWGEKSVPRMSELRCPHVLGLSNLDISPWLEEIGDDDNLTRLELNSCRMSGKALHPLSNAKGLRQLSVRYDFVKEILGELRYLPKLEVLAISGGKLQPGDWAPLGELRELGELMVSGCAFADADLAVLKSNVNLRRLDISSSQISAQGIGRLPDFCPHLEWLKLDSLLLTDDAVERLRGLSKLKELRIVPHHPEVKDLTMLRAKLAGCKIEFHYGHDGRS